MSSTTRRAALTALASASALALPAVAIAATAAPDADAELFALAAEIKRLCALGGEIYATRVDPFEEKFNNLLDGALLTVKHDRTKWDEAFAYSRQVGREAAIKEVAVLDGQADRLWARMMAIPAATPAGRAAKVRALLAHVCPEWRGPADGLDDWQKEQIRALLGQLASGYER